MAGWQGPSTEPSPSRLSTGASRQGSRSGGSSPDSSPLGAGVDGEVLGWPVGDGVDVVESVGPGVEGSVPMIVGAEVGVGVDGSVGGDVGVGAELVTVEGEVLPTVDGPELVPPDGGTIGYPGPGGASPSAPEELGAEMSTGEVAVEGAPAVPDTLGAAPPAAIDDPPPPAPPEPPAPIPEA